MSILKIVPHFSKFCVWRTGPPRNGKFSKIPINPITGGSAKVNDPETFGTYEQAAAEFERGVYQGVGVLLSSGTDTIIVDIDDCLDDAGMPGALAQTAIDLFGKTFTEVSQSKRGLHFIMRGVLPSWVTREKVTIDGHSVEVYSKSSTRFICITGDELHEAPVIANQAALEVFLRQFGFDQNGQSATGVEAEGPGGMPDSLTDTDTDTVTVEHADNEIIGLLRQRNKRGRITRLLAGDASDYKDASGAVDLSSADGALCFEIAYYTKDYNQIQRIFETSKLAARDKWKTRKDYRERTINGAIERTQGHYWGTAKVAGSGSVVKGVAALVTANARYAVLLSGGVAELALTPKGRIASTVANGMWVLAHSHQTMGRIAYNEFGGMLLINAPLRELFGGIAPIEQTPFHEDHLIHVRGWFNTLEMSFGHDDCLRLILAVAQSNKVNPVRDALDLAHDGWDGVHRLENALATYFNVDVQNNLEYHRAVLKAWMISACARVYAPGSKVDHVLVLEGKQGTGKSSAVKALVDAIAPDYFAEGLPLISGGNDVKLALRGKWVIELAELGAVRKADTEQVKAFLSATSDSLRVPYGKMFETWPRRAVFIGTANNSEYIADESGGRRFWGVSCGVIDVKALTRDARQLWGEAVHRYRAGEVWHLIDPLAIKQAKGEQAARQVSDAWDDSIRGFMGRTFTERKSLEQSWQIAELFGAIFPSSHITANPQEFDQIKKNRFSACLRRAGWHTRKSMGLNRWRLSDETRDSILTSEEFLRADPIGFAMGTPIASRKLQAVSCGETRH